MACSSIVVPRIVTRTVRVDGIEARYSCAGSGPPVLVVASPLGSASPYVPLVRALASTFTVVVLELPGSGGSTPLRAPWTSRQYGAFVVEVVRKLPLAAPVVIAHGAAAAIAIEATRVAPREIRALVLADPSGVGAFDGLRDLVVALASDVTREPSMIVRWAPSVVANAVRHRATFAAHIRAACGSAVLESAPYVTVPATLACGERTRMLPLARANVVAAALGVARIVVGQGGHDWLLAKPAAFAAQIRRFVVGTTRRIARSALPLGGVWTASTVPSTP